MPLYKHGTFHLCEGAWNTQLRLWPAKTEENLWSQYVYTCTLGDQSIEWCSPFLFQFRFVLVILNKQTLRHFSFVLERTAGLTGVAQNLKCK